MPRNVGGPGRYGFRHARQWQASMLFGGGRLLAWGCLFAGEGTEYPRGNHCALYPTIYTVYTKPLIRAVIV